MEVFLEMRSGFREVDEQVRVWKENIHSLKLTPMTADSYVLLYEEVLSGIDLLDLSSAMLIEKFKENCSVRSFLKLLKEDLKSSQEDIRINGIYTSKSKVLDDRVSRKYREHWDEISERLEAVRVRLRNSSKHLKKVCSTLSVPEVAEGKKPKVQLNEQIAGLAAVLEKSPGYHSLYRKDVAKIAVVILHCSEDYAAKTLSSCGENYQGNDTKYTGWTYLEEARTSVKKLDKILEKLNGK